MIRASLAALLMSAPASLVVRSNGNNLGTPAILDFGTGMACYKSGPGVYCMSTGGVSLPLSGSNGGFGGIQPTCSGTDKVTCNGTTCSCATDQSSSYTLPAATATVLGGVKGTGSALVCSGTNKATGFDSAGTLQCAADQDTIYTLPAATATVLGGVKGTGASLTCSGTDKVTGFNASGTLQCGTDDPGPAPPSLPLSGPNGGLGQAQPTCGAGTFLQCNGTTCSCVSAGVPSLPLAGSNGGLGQAQPTCSAGQHLTCNGTTCSCSADTGGGAPTTSKYLLQQADGSLPNAQAMGALGTGIVKNTTTTGVQSIASSGTDYSAGTSANGTGLVFSTTGTGALTSYGGTSCSNQFTRSLNASGVATCSGIGVNDFTANQGSQSWVLHGNGAGQPEWRGIAMADFVANQGATTTVLHGNAAGQPSYAGVTLADFTANQGTATTLLHGNAAGQPSFSGVTVNDFTANQGSLTQVLHGNGAGQPSWSPVSYNDLTPNTGTTTTVLHGNAAGQPSYTGVTLADFTANQGATNTLLHGNATGQPSFGSVGLTTDVTGILQTQNGGTSTNAAPPNGGSAYGTGSALAWTAAGSAGQLLMSNGAAAPTWSNRHYGFRITGSNYTNSTTTVSNITGLAISVASGETGSIRCQMMVQNSNAASAIRYGVNGPAMTTFSSRISHATTSVSALQVDVFTATSAAVQTGSVTASVITTVHIDIIEIGYITSAAGTIQIIAAGSAAQLHTVFQGSSCMVQ